MNEHKSRLDFSFQATNNLHARLSDYLGQVVVLYFYPKDATLAAPQKRKILGTDMRILNV